ncbi:MAG TPA: hypothetical protein VKM55_13590 [Candidatus Lokiarchaeia archaeon]|nr:hypothetical protein [Candidatus Lokiarchaeia archaeon]
MIREQNHDIKPLVTDCSFINHPAELSTEEMTKVFSFMFHAWSIPVLVLFMIYGTLVMKHAFVIKNTKDQEVLDFLNESTYLNEILLAGLFYASGILWPFLYDLTGASPAGTDFLYAVSTITILAVSSNWYGQGLFNFIRCRRGEKGYLEKRKRLDEEAGILEKYRAGCAYGIGVDARRKFLHLLPGLIIILVQWGSFVLKNSTTIYADLGITREAFAIFGESTIAYIFVFMIGYADYLRLMAYYQLPNWAKRWFFSSVKRSEMKTFVSSCALVLTLTPFLFAPMQIFVSVAFVSSLADAAANLIGRKWGKHNFPKGSSKTEAGYIAGTASAFIVVLVFSSWFNYTALPMLLIFYLACTASAIFFMIDRFSKNLSDNILNPLLTGAGMLLVFFIL